MSRDGGGILLDTFWTTYRERVRQKRGKGSVASALAPLLTPSFIRPLFLLRWNIASANKYTRPRCLSSAVSLLCRTGTEMRARVSPSNMKALWQIQRRLGLRSRAPLRIRQIQRTFFCVLYSFSLSLLEVI